MNETLISVLSLLGLIVIAGFIAYKNSDKFKAWIDKIKN